MYPFTGPLRYIVTCTFCLQRNTLKQTLKINACVLGITVHAFDHIIMITTGLSYHNCQQINGHLNLPQLNWICFIILPSIKIQSNRPILCLISITTMTSMSMPNPKCHKIHPFHIPGFLLERTWKQRKQHEITSHYCADVKVVIKVRQSIRNMWSLFLNPVVWWNIRVSDVILV